MRLQCSRVLQAQRLIEHGKDIGRVRFLFEIAIQAYRTFLMDCDLLIRLDIWRQRIRLQIAESPTHKCCCLHDKQYRG